MICHVLSGKMKLHLLSMTLLLVSLCGCATKSLLVEVRTDNTAPRVKRIHFVDSGSVSSGALSPQPIRQDEKSTVFSNHGLIHGPGTGFVVVDLDKTGRSEVYELNWVGFRNQKEWSDWITPDVSGATDNGRHICMRLLYDDTLSTTNSVDYVTLMRYQMKRFKY
jgi:hypothetical protein